MQRHFLQCRGSGKNYIEMGFKVAFLRAGDFKKFKKDYKDFI